LPHRAARHRGNDFTEYYGPRGYGARWFFFCHAAGFLIQACTSLASHRVAVPAITGFGKAPCRARFLIVAGVNRTMGASSLIVIKRSAIVSLIAAHPIVTNRVAT
jgi:hypothetical protein